jgi:hypothetical protein
VGQDHNIFKVLKHTLLNKWKINWKLSKSKVHWNISQMKEKEMILKVYSHLNSKRQIQISLMLIKKMLSVKVYLLNQIKIFSITTIINQTLKMMRICYNRMIFKWLKSRLFTIMQKKILLKWNIKVLLFNNLHQDLNLTINNNSLISNINRSIIFSKKLLKFHWLNNNNILNISLQPAMLLLLIKIFQNQHNNNSISKIKNKDNKMIPLWQMKKRLLDNHLQNIRQIKPQCYLKEEVKSQIIKLKLMLSNTVLQIKIN